MVNPNQGTKSTKEISTDYPQDSGTGDDDKHEGRQINLVYEITSVPCRYRQLI